MPSHPEGGIRGRTARVLVTGAGGFIGRALTHELLSAGPAGIRAEMGHLVLLDRSAVPARSSERVRVETVTGDLADPAVLDAVAERAFDSIFHLAATLTLDAERDPEAAYRVNVEALRRMIERAGTPKPRIVFTSSIAVFGGELPETVDDGVRATPTTAYGTHKAVCELLLADASRRGRIDGRALRLPIVLLRRGAATPTVSDRVAAILREPLAGLDVVCPLAPETRIPVASARAVGRALLALHDAPAHEMPVSRVMNLPALSITVAEMVAALDRLRQGGPAIGRVEYRPDPNLQAIVDGWPKRFVSEAASRLGLAGDPDLASILARYRAESEGTHHAR